MRSLRTRGMWLAMLFVVGFTTVSIRLVYLQFIKHGYYRDQAIKMHYTGVPIPPKRGNILDRSGNILAQTVMVTDLRIDGKLAWEKPEIFKKLAPILDISEKDLRTSIRSEKRYMLLARNMSDDLLRRLKSLRSRCLIFKERMARAYPNGKEGSHVLGFVNVEQILVNEEKMPVEFEIGVDGIEKAMDRYLRGVPGERRVVRDASRREIAAYRQSDRPARDGLDVVLTIDQVVQNIVEVEADRLMEEHLPEAVHIIVVKPSTGEILALTNRPTFDPNVRQTMNPKNLRNCAIMDIYEPGSTFKIVTLAAALNENAADLDMPVFCENGKFFYGGKWLTDSKEYGMLTLREVVAKSSNIGFAKLGLLLGQQRVYEYAKKFGFGNQTQGKFGSLAGEEGGMLHSLKNWTALSLTRVPMGYEVAVTNLQMALAFSAVANGGRLMEPQLIKTVVDKNGKPAAQLVPRTVRQIVQPEVAEKMREALRGVVSENGTARLAAVEGFAVAGKTGTAQKLIDGAYDHENFISSFIGFLPAERPKFLVSVVVDRPRGKKYYGGLVAAPAFSNIATKVAQQLNLVPSNAALASTGGEPR